MSKQMRAAIFLVITLLTAVWTQSALASSLVLPEMQATPLGSAVGRAVNVEFRTDPTSLRADLPFTAQLTLRGQQVSGCQGIPGSPLDLFFVVDNSASAGDGSETSNLGITRQMLLAFANLLEQKVYAQTAAGQQALTSRVGLVASQVGAQGTQIYEKSLTDDTGIIRETITGIAVGGDTDQTDGFTKAVDTLLKVRRAEARPVIVLMLHDKLPVQGGNLTVAAEDARKKGIDVFVFSNSKNIGDKDRLSAVAQNVVDGKHFFEDSTVQKMREIFIQMSNGSTNWVARDIAVMLTWRPERAVAISAPNPVGAKISGDAVAWTVANLADNQTVVLSHAARIQNPGVTGLDAEWNVAYIDCNGFPAAQAPETRKMAVQPPPAVTATVIPPAATQAAATAVPGATRLVTATPRPTDIVIPVAAVICPPDFCRPLLISLGLGALPDWLQCLILILLLLLLLLLLYLLYRLIRWLFNRKPAQLPTGGGGAPVVSGGGVVPVGDRDLAWLTRLTVERKAMPERQTTEKPQFQETLLLGIGPAGRVVLSQVAESLNERFGGEWPDNVRLLQVDVRMNPDAPVPAEPPAGLSADQWVTLDPKMDDIETNLHEEPEEWPFWRWFPGTAPAYERSLGRMALFYDLRNGTQNSRFWKGVHGALRGLDSPVVKVVGSTFDDTSSGMLVDALRLVQLISEREAMDAQLWLCGPLKREWSQRLLEKARVRPDEQVRRTLATLRELERFQRNEKVSYNFVSHTSAADVLRREYAFAPVQSVFLFEPSDSRSAPEDDVLASMADLLLATFNQSVHQALAQLYKPSMVTAGDRVNRSGDGYIASLGSFTVRRPIQPLEEALAWRLVRDSLFESAAGILPVESVEPSDGSYQPLAGRFSEETLSPDQANADVDAVIGQVRAAGGRSLAPLFGLVRNRLNDLLNGEQSSGVPVRHRRNSLDNALLWLDQLNRQLKYYRLDLEAGNAVADLRSQLLTWKSALASAAKPQVEARLEAAREKLGKLRTQPPRSWDLNETLEWHYYNKYVREGLPNGSLDNNALLWLGSRFGWEVQYVAGGNRFSVNLLLPPADFEYYSGAKVSEYMVNAHHVSEDPAGFINRLFNLALPKIRAQVGTTALEIAEHGSISDWLKIAKPRMEYNDGKATQLMRLVESRTLLVTATRDRERVEKAQDKILHSPHLFGTSVDVCSASDPGSLTILTAISYVPFSTLNVYSETEWRTNPVSPSHYVWLPEQQAARVERYAAEDGSAPRRLSGLFVGWLGRDEALLRTFSLGLIYNVIHRRAGRWQLPGLEPGIEATSAAEALHKLMTMPAFQQKSDEQQAEILKAGQAGIGTARKKIDAENSRTVYLNTFRKDTVTPMLASEVVLERDLGAYLMGLIEEEKNRK